MNPARILAMMGNGPQFIGAGGGGQSAGSIAIPWPTGTRAGDFGFVFANNNSAPAALSTGGWTTVDPTGVGGRIYWKALSSADLTATATMTGSSSSNTLYCWVFRGFASANSLSSQGAPINDGTTSRTWTGATKGASCRGLIFFMSGNVSATQTITAPTMANSQDYPVGNSTGQYPVRLKYDLYPSDYTSGTGITESYGAGWTQISIVVLELT